MSKELEKSKCKLHIAMYPWFAIGHIRPFLHLANKLAEHGHKTSFFVPPNTQPKLATLNNHPTLITFIPISVPRVDGLTVGAETTNDVPAFMQPMLMSAMDLTRGPIELHLAQLRPDIVFFDCTEWLPSVARKYGAKSVYYCVTFIMNYAYICPNARPNVNEFKEGDLVGPPPGFPSHDIRMRPHEARDLAFVCEMDFGGRRLIERHIVGCEECDAIGWKTCRELEGPFCEFVEKHSKKPLFLAGPVLPISHSDSRLDELIDGRLKGFGDGSVVYCAFGSEVIIEKGQFQELVLGLELTGMPFLVALRPPNNCTTLESALPEGFLERTKDRGIIHDGWIEQQQILQHPSVGCFVTHCGAGSLLEGIMSNCQIVLLPQAFEQFLNARIMSSYLRLGIEVEKDDDGFFTGETVRKAVCLVMEEESKIGREVKINHAKWRDVLSKKGLEETYIVKLVQDLQALRSSV